jgi:anti-sigma factor RsiW
MPTPAPTKDQIVLVHAYFDGELDVASALGVKEQIDANPLLAAELANATALRDALRRHFPPEPIPTRLAQRINSAIGVRRLPARPTWLALAACVLLAIGVSSGSTWLALQRSGPAPDRIVEEVVDGHLRSLFSQRTTDVTASESHVVKPWLSSRLPRVPRVVDLAKDGFPLSGARIEVVARTPVPVLVYMRRLHVISLVALPISDATTELTTRRTESGHNVARWRDGDTTYVATSDLNVEELAQFAKLFRAAPS